MPLRIPLTLPGSARSCLKRSVGSLAQTILTWVQALTLTLLLPTTTQAQTTELELVLLADASGSITPAELQFQRRSYADAITDPSVLSVIEGSAYGSIAVTYVEWAANTGQVTPWMLIDGPETAAAFADALTGPQAAFGRNAIGGALLDAKRLIETNDHDGWRRVIDFSGDSANNFNGPPIGPSRQEVLDAGIIINALAISSADRPGLAEQYRTRIIGGPGAFVVEAEGRDDFASAVRRKLILEIGGLGKGTTVAGR